MASKAPLGDEWLHEIKYDGYRILAFKKNGLVRLLTRNHNDWTDTFESVVTQIQKLPYDNLILDGEVVVLDEHEHSNFQLLQNSIKEQSAQFIYYVFDLLYYDQYDLTSLPLIERKNILQQMISSNSGILRYSDHVKGSGQAILNKACELGLEGIVSKNLNSHYVQKRSQTWLKTKCSHRQEFVIGGFTKPQGQRSYFGSLLLGTFNKNKELLYHGNVGTGFTQTSLEEIHKLLKKNITDENPFNVRPKLSGRVTWVKPVLTCEVEFSEWTEDNSLRHPSFKGLRLDKNPLSIVKEQPLMITKHSRAKTEAKTRVQHLKKENAAIEKALPISNPSKILYPEDKLTKLQLAEYYEHIQDWILPYLVNRPLTLVRCPQSYKSCFYQKHINAKAPEGLYKIPIKEKDGQREDYLYIKDSKGLISLVQLGALELHPWGSRIETVEEPDLLIFDLDPGLDVPWKKIVKSAFDIKEKMESIHLKSFVKTTGGKGLHIVIPIRPQFDWGTVKDFTHQIAEVFVQTNPKDYVGKMTKALRQGKIFIDYLRNQRGATAIAPYSTRARKGCPIATPLHWEELTHNFKDTHFTLKNIIKRLDSLKTDPWQDFYKIKQKLPLKKR